MIINYLVFYFKSLECSIRTSITKEILLDKYRTHFYNIYILLY